MCILQFYNFYKFTVEVFWFLRLDRHPTHCAAALHILQILLDHYSRTYKIAPFVIMHYIIFKCNMIKIFGTYLLFSLQAFSTINLMWSLSYDKITNNILRFRLVVITKMWSVTFDVFLFQIEIWKNSYKTKLMD